MKIQKEKIKNWLKNPYNLALVSVLVFAFAIRLYYFILTQSQPLWWDEAAYGSLAQNYLSHIWDGTEIIIGETNIRPPLFPHIWSVLIFLGIGEVGSRFILEFIPSIVSVFFVYLIAKEGYGKRTALISTFIFSVLWIHLFYTGRLLTNVPAMGFLFPSIYLFLKSTKNKFSPKLFGASILLLSISTLIRYPIGLFFFVYLFFLIGTKEFKVFSNKKFWISGIIGGIPILFFFFLNFINYGNIFPALLGGDYAEPVSKSFAFEILNFILVYLTWPFFIFFIIGLLFVISEMVLGYDLWKRKNNLRVNLVLILALIVIYAYFIFVIKGAQDRWLLPMSISLVAFAGLGISRSYNYVKKYSKHIAVIFLLGLLAFGGYSQLQIADSLINDRKTSFLEIRQGFEWIEENLPEDGIVIGRSIQPYAIYYAKQQYRIMPQTAFEIDEIDDADYLIVHAFRPHPEDIWDYLSQNQDKWVPIHGFFFDEQGQQPAFIIYQKSKDFGDKIREVISEL